MKKRSIISMATAVFMLLAGAAFTANAQVTIGGDELSKPRLTWLSQKLTAQLPKVLWHRD